MGFVIEGETDDGDYFAVEDILTFDDLLEWIDYFDGIGIDFEWEYEGE